ncbi:MAG: phosphotransferase [Thiotrichaceae bacterium]
MLPIYKGKDAALLRSELRFQYSYSAIDLPRGVIHADLFRDNALFEGDKLCGIIDFYYACYDVLLYDVAVTVNDWCSLPDGELDNARMEACSVAINNNVRLPLKNVKHGVMLRAVALRFWVSRLKDLHFPRMR